MNKINYKKIAIFLFTTVFFFSFTVLSIAQENSDGSYGPRLQSEPSFNKTPSPSLNGSQYIPAFTQTSVSAPTSVSKKVVIQNPLGKLNSVPVFVSDLLSYVVKIGGIVAIFAFIYSGFLFVKARGNPGELTKANTVFKNTIIGVVVLLGAQLIASIIIGTIKNLKQ